MTDTLNSAARHALFNFLDGEFFPRLNEVAPPHSARLHGDIGAKFFSLSYDQVMDNSASSTTSAYSPEGKYRDRYRDLIITGEENHVIEYLQFILEWGSRQSITIQEQSDTFRVPGLYIEGISRVFNENNAGYKISGEKLIPLMNDDEEGEVARAAAVPYPFTRGHIKKARRYFYDAKYLDYANSIKESILAIEAIGKELTKSKNVGKKCIKDLKKKGIALHPSFEEVLVKLYGYTSNEGGVRHADHEEPVQVNQSTARFMLVVCSTYVNFIIANIPDSDKQPTEPGKQPTEPGKQVIESGKQVTETIYKYLRWAASAEGGYVIYRGLADKDWELKSSLERKLGEGTSFTSMLENTQKTLAKAKEHGGHIIEGGQGFSDLDMLVCMQHFGVPTFLIDFTNNPLVALWFACQDGGKDTDGKIISFDANDAEDFTHALGGNMKKDITCFSEKNKLYKLEPSFGLRERIAMQDSIFLFGAEGISEDLCGKFIIPKEEKEEILVALREKFGTHVAMTYPDFMSFSQPGFSLNDFTEQQYFESGVRASAQEKTDKAISDFSEVIKLNKNNIDAYKFRGLAYADQRQYDKAIQDFSKAIELQSNDAIAYNNRGIIYKIRKEYSGAIADFNMAIKLAPGNASAYNNRGSIYYSLKEYDNAIADFSKVIELTPYNTSARMDRGRAYFNKEKYDHAIADFGKVIELLPNYMQAYSARAAAYGGKKDYDNAIVDLNRSIELAPKNANEYNNRGAVYSWLGKYEQAIDDFNRAVELDPYNAKAYHDRGYTKRKLGNEKEALEDFAIADALGFQRPSGKK